MNCYTRQIVALLNISLEKAETVQYEMDCSGIDYSECSTRKFNNEASLAYFRLVNEERI